MYKLLILVLGIGSIKAGERHALCCWLHRIYPSEANGSFDGWMDSWILMLLLKFKKYSFVIFYRIIL